MGATCRPVGEELSAGLGSVGRAIVYHPASPSECEAREQLITCMFFKGLSGGCRVGIGKKRGRETG